MQTFIDGLKERNFQNRTIGIIENGSWAPVAAKNIKSMMEGCKNLTWTETAVTIKSVSYTHLDVYKRQQLQLSLLWVPEKQARRVFMNICHRNKIN